MSLPGENPVEPRVKGTIVLGVVASLRKLRRSGQLSAAQLAARLSGPALELLDQKIEFASWYPMRLFRELVEFEWDEVAKRDPDYARTSGELSADHQAATGRYQQLDSAGRTRKVETSGALVLQARLITTVTSAFYSFLKTHVAIDPARPDRLEIVYANAADFAEPLRYATEGFMNRINERQGSSRRWKSERTDPDRIVFWMELPERLVR
jgi:hypothetical protein